MAETAYWVGLVKNAGHALATFLVGEMVDQDVTTVTVRNIIRVLESPAQDNRVSLNFMTDNFFTTDNPVQIERSSLLMSRLLDPQLDSELIRQIGDFLSQRRAVKSGPVPGAVGKPGSRKVLQEKQ